MAECRMELGDDYAKTLSMAAILIWPILTIKVNNAFSQ
jgi:hypothetical protein